MVLPRVNSGDAAQKISGAREILEGRTMTTKPTPHCIGCNKDASEMEEYIDAALANDTGVNAYVRAEEGTYNPENGHFLCTPCYAKAGCPTSPRGWRAP